MIGFITVALAFWLYGGRAVLLAGFLSASRGQSSCFSATIGFAVGLVLLPFVMTLAFFSSTPFLVSVAAFILIDVVLAFLWLRRLRQRISLPSARAILLVVFAVCCCVLSWFNGSYIELLADAWWHMEKASSILYAQEIEVVLESPVTEVSWSNPKDWVGWLFGVESTSYRMHALLAWLSGAPMIESWSASSVVVSTLIGVSFALFVYSLGLSVYTSALCLFFWLVLMGGLNTSLRLSAWPAGMGYVFLNFGLIACYQLFKNFQSGLAWLLFLACVVGAASFHIGEAFLISLALVFLIVGRFLMVDFSWVKSTIIAALMITVLIALSVVDVERISTLEDNAFLLSGGFVFCLWLTGLFIKQHRDSYHNIFLLAIGGVLIGVLGVLVDWGHLVLLFQPHLNVSGSGYIAHFPKNVAAIGGDAFYLPKWEHQLRASLLWSGIASMPLAVWLCFQRPDKLSFYLAILVLVPLFILVSPYFFTSMMAFMPGHGVYRIQFLMPVAIVLALSLVAGLEGVFSRNLSDLAIPSIFDFAQIGEVVRRVLLAGLIIGIVYAAYFYLARVLLGFSAAIVLPGAAEVLAVIGCLILLFKVSLKRALALVVVIVSVSAVMPDFLFRTGVMNQRPWAVHSNSDFHWKLESRTKTILDHTSWRYQDDLNMIRGFVSDNPQSGFISDVATSYYVAAASMLEPLIQQDHHATREGEGFRRWFARLCSGEVSAQGFRNMLENYNSNTDQPQVKFVVINRDTRNYTAEYNGTACVGEEKKLPLILAQFSEKLYDGEYLSLWTLSE